MELVLGLFGRRLFHLLYEQVVLDSPPPDVLGFGLTLRPLRSLAVDDKRLLLREVV